MFSAKPSTFSNGLGVYSMYFNTMDYSKSLEHGFLHLTPMK